MRYEPPLQLAATFICSRNGNPAHTHCYAVLPLTASPALASANFLASARSFSRFTARSRASVAFLRPASTSGVNSFLSANTRSNSTANGM